MSSAWTGQHLGDVLTVCLFHPGPLQNAERVPRPYLICKSGSKSCLENVMVRPDQLLQFFTVHADSILVCHHAASLHWRIHDYFEAEGDHRAMGTLWNHSRHCRLHDVVLLEQRSRLARSGRRALPSSLDRLFGFSPSTDQGFVIDPTHADTIIDAIAEHYEPYHGNARNLAAGLGVSEETIARFGPLGQGGMPRGPLPFSVCNAKDFSFTGTLSRNCAIECLRHFNGPPKNLVQTPTAEIALDGAETWSSEIAVGSQKSTRQIFGIGWQKSGRIYATTITPDGHFLSMTKVNSPSCPHTGGRY